MQLDIKKVSFRYNNNSPWILKDINLTFNSNEKIALVGPSGYGKSTLAQIIAGYIKPTSGEILLDGNKISETGYNPIQLIYQHPEKAVNPRLKMKKILNEGFEVSDELLSEFGIEKSWLNRWPSELSGGELQRFCIARVLGDKTKFLICDEISTMLDVITQAQIWNTLLKYSKKNNLGMLVVTHNMNLANRVCDKIINLADINNLADSNKVEEKIVS